MTAQVTYVSQNIAHIKSRLEVALASFTDIKITQFSYNKFNDEISLFLNICETTPRLYFSGREYGSKASFQTVLNVSLARLYYTRTAKPNEFKLSAFSPHVIVAILDDKKASFKTNEPDLSKMVYDLAKGILYIDRIQKALDTEQTRSPLQCPRITL